ncbi:MAG TPA: hypothetical protein VNS32_25405 [Flavisolibacter sp.]|nr:hypothetical protein [Flavisolibacter sp.]
MAVAVLQYVYTPRSGVSDGIGEKKAQPVLQRFKGWHPSETTTT